MKPGAKLLRGPLPWVLGVLIVLWIASGLYRAATAPEVLTWTEFQQVVARGELADSTLEATTVGNRTDTIDGVRRVGGR